jgi:Holliday junction resolvase
VGASERTKGVRGEREVAAVLRAHGLPCDRTIQQAGVFVRGDLTGVPGYHFEVKRQEVLRLPTWLRQAAAEAPAEAVPVVTWRQSKGHWYATLPLNELAHLLDLARLAR